jgi:signal transduction histidine kinase
MSHLPLALAIHDLKNALGGLEGQLLAMTEAPTVEAAQAAHTNCVELRQQVVQFLTVYSTEHGLRAMCEDESPQDLVKQLVQDARAGLFGNIQKTLEFEADLGQAPPFWYYDRRLVRMALEAALHNAERFAERRIVIGVAKQDEHLIFFIEDDGPGLGAQDASTHSTGLGTHLCQSIALAHQSDGRMGRVRLENRPEVGARFELWLP